MNLLLLPIIVALGLVLLHTYVRVKPRDCPNGHGRMTSRRVSGMLTRVHWCENCNASFSKYITAHNALLTNLEIFFNYCTLRFIPPHYFTIRIESKLFALSRRFKSISPVLELPTYLSPSLWIGAIGGYNIALASGLFHAQNGITPKLGFSFSYLLRKRKMKLCRRCGTVATPLTKKGNYEWTLQGFVFCSENCLRVFKQENTCGNCGKFVKASPIHMAHVVLCNETCLMQYRKKLGKFANEIPVELERRSFSKKLAIGIVGAVAAAMFVGDQIGKASATINPPASMTSYYSQYGTTGDYTVLDFLDTNGNAYLKNGDNLDMGMLAGTITSNGQTYGAGTAGVSSTTDGMQEGFNMLQTLTNSTNPVGVFKMRRGSYSNSTQVTIPNNSSGLCWCGEGAGGSTAQLGSSPKGGTIISASANMSSLVTISGGISTGYAFNFQLRDIYFTNQTSSVTFSSGAMCAFATETPPGKAWRFWNVTFEDTKGANSYTVDTTNPDDDIYYGCKNKGNPWLCGSQDSGAVSWVGGQLLGSVVVQAGVVTFDALTFTNLTISNVGVAGNHVNSYILTGVFFNGGNIINNSGNQANIVMIGGHLNGSPCFSGSASSPCYVEMIGTNINTDSAAILLFSASDSGSKARWVGVTLSGNSTCTFPNGIGVVSAPGNVNSSWPTGSFP